MNQRQVLVSPRGVLRKSVGVDSPRTAKYNRLVITDQATFFGDSGRISRGRSTGGLLIWNDLSTPAVISVSSDGAIDGESFRAYIEQILVPTLQPGDIVIADNLGAHKVAGIQRPSRPPGPPSGTCHPTARTSIPSSSASRSSRPSFAPLAVAAPRRSGRSSARAWRTSALTNAATIFGTAGTRPPHGHEKRFRTGAAARRRCEAHPR